LRHILEVILILRPDFYLLQLDPTVTRDDHDELPAGFKVHHCKSDGIPSHTDQLKAPEAFVVVCPVG